MTRTERVEREIADIKNQTEIMKQETKEQEKTKPKRSGFFGLIGAFIIGFILGLLLAYFFLP